MTSSRLEQMQVNLTLAYVVNDAATDKFGHHVPGYGSYRHRHPRAGRRGY